MRILRICVLLLGSKIPHVIQKYTKRAYFVRPYFTHFTTFRDEILRRVLLILKARSHERFLVRFSGEDERIQHIIRH